MSDYNVIIDYAPKDALNTGDPDKLILGTELAAEFTAIATAIATKFDSTDFATQAQAEAAASTTTVLSPGRLANWAAYNAGAVQDIQALTDPGGDRLLYWNDTNNAVEWLSLGAGLDFSTGTLVVDLSEVDVSTLGGLTANMYVDHSTVEIIAGVGLAGGGDLTASRTLSMDIDGLTALPALDEDNDQIAVYDASADAIRKTPLSAFRGITLGDGRWGRTTGQSLTAGVEATLICNVNAYDELTRGTYDTSTGIYTAGASGARLLVTGGWYTDSIAKGGIVEALIYENSTCVARGHINSDRDSTSGPYGVSVSACVVLAAGETCKLVARASAACTTSTGAGRVYLNIVELA